jgi:prepilin-type N-terminal cleavage/methylation domain-containing protein
MSAGEESPAGRIAPLSAVNYYIIFGGCFLFISEPAIGFKRENIGGFPFFCYNIYYISVSMKKFARQFNKKGFTLIESLVGIFVFAIISIGVYEAFISAIQLTEVSRLMVDSTALASEQFEIAHNLPYADVGILGGLPSGKLAAEKTVIRDNNEFLVKTTVRSIDDPFDGTIGGSPNDSSPADYKLVEVEISASRNFRFNPIAYTEYIAPKNLENTTNNGALFVRVFDSSGQPVPGASVHIENNAAVPSFQVDDTTNNDGILALVDVPPGIGAYEITVTRPGYSQDRTYPVGALENPSPVKPHATVIAQQATQLSFFIDKVSALTVESVTPTCQHVAGIDFNLKGSRLIGSEPDVLKYDNNFDTGASGIKDVSDLEWDSYNLTLTDPAYDLSGSIPLTYFSLAPDSVLNLKVIVALKNPQSLQVSVKQAGTQLPLSGVTLLLARPTSTSQLITGRGFLRQTDWSGGGGQINFSDPAKYFDSDGNIETADPAGEMKLKNVFGLYENSGELTSSSFDTGSASNFYQLSFSPLSQPPEIGTGTVKLQIATNEDNATWNYKGPDGTDSTFYSSADPNINSLHNGDRYLRYKIYFSTASSTFTPDVTEVNFTFSSLCVPSGQVMFDGLEDGNYTLTASKSGFETTEENINISSPWQRKEIELMPLP